LAGLGVAQPSLQLDDVARKVVGGAWIAAQRALGQRIRARRTAQP
jgi:hypothetical protein